MFNLLNKFKNYVTRHPKDVLLILASITIVGGGLFYYFKTSNANVWEIKMQDDAIKITIPENLLPPRQQ
ncbi:MAG: hypothetical protein K2Y18_02450 [Alphaproteobacteria bacterium]|nr:hypothetical protein [Alphaproteobacteria bacterium]